MRALSRGKKMQTVVIWVVSCIAIALVGLLVGACWMTMPFAALPQVPLGSLMTIALFRLCAIPDRIRSAFDVAGASERPEI